jgi:hypothetical protein
MVFRLVGYGEDGVPIYVDDETFNDQAIEQEGELPDTNVGLTPIRSMDVPADDSVPTHQYLLETNEKYVAMGIVGIGLLLVALWAMSEPKKPQLPPWLLKLKPKINQDISRNEDDESNIFSLQFY